MTIIDPGIIVCHFDYAFDFDEDHFAVFITWVHEEEIKTVDSVSVGLSVENSDNSATSSVKVVKSALNERGITPACVAVY